MMGNENGDRLQASLDLLKDKLRVPRIHNDGLPESIALHPEVIVPKLGQSLALNGVGKHFDVT